MTFRLSSGRLSPGRLNTGLAALAIAASVVVAGCSEARLVSEAARAVHETAAPPVDPTPLAGPVAAAPASAVLPGEPTSVEYGEATWYGAALHGNLTASGERFDMNAMTAAHKTLPFFSLVRVTNLDNGRQIVLRITDRGPFAPGRIIDVSERAAELLGFKRAGVANVQVEAYDPVEAQLRGNVQEASNH